ncbi:MAG TPA: hypothetical protein PKA58_17845, partial [Polyangium sp.]|nr:hypothetical protein [Polyangium sp.]
MIRIFAAPELLFCVDAVFPPLARGTIMMPLLGGIMPFLLFRNLDTSTTGDPLLRRNSTMMNNIGGRTL